MTRVGLLIFLLCAGGSLYAQSPIVSDFDHDTTTFRLEGAHQIASCGDCHSYGRLDGAPIRCEGCHTSATAVSASAKPSFHLITTNNCESCHNAFAWTPVVDVDHSEVIGDCASCHDNRQAIGKPIDHLPTQADCSGCHRTSLFALASFTHDGIASGCLNCHNNRIAQGKPADHIPAPDSCEDCHQTQSFSAVFGRTADDPMLAYLKTTRTQIHLSSEIRQQP